MCMPSGQVLWGGSTGDSLPPDPLHSLLALLAVGEGDSGVVLLVGVGEGAGRAEAISLAT